MKWMKNKIVFALTLMMIAYLQTAGAARANADDCEYVPIAPTAAGETETMGLSNVHEIHILGCKTQCLSRVFCLSDHPEFRDPKRPPSLQDKVALGKDVNCDANPSASVAGVSVLPSCAPADECMASVRKDPSRIAKQVTPAAKDAAFLHMKDKNFALKYGIIRDQPSTTVPLYSLPALPHFTKKGKLVSDPSSCRFCASQVTAATLAWSFIACPVTPIPDDEVDEDAENNNCRGANDCASYRQDDGTAKAAAFYAVPKSQRKHEEPTTSVGTTPSAAGSAQVPGGHP